MGFFPPWEGLFTKYWGSAEAGVAKSDFDLLVHFYLKHFFYLFVRYFYSEFLKMSTCPYRLWDNLGNSDNYFCHPYEVLKKQSVPSEPEIFICKKIFETVCIIIFGILPWCIYVSISTKQSITEIRPYNDKQEHCMQYQCSSVRGHHSTFSSKQIS